VPRLASGSARWRESAVRIDAGAGTFHTFGSTATILISVSKQQ
jgi:hypothetical protein